MVIKVYVKIMIHFLKKIFSLNSGEFIWFKNKECIKKKILETQTKRGSKN